MFIFNKNIKKSNHIVLKCGHNFHKTCFENFTNKYEVNKLCPICNIVFDYKLKII